MKKSVRAGATLVTMALIAAFVVSTGAALAQEESPTGSNAPVTFTVGFVNDAVTFNPMTMIETSEYETAGTMYNLLLGFDQETLEPVPEVAELPTRSEDGLTWTFEIRPGQTWTDGSPVTADDVAYTYNLILDEGFSAYSDYLPYTDEIVAEDEDTLVWRTTRPTGAPLYPPYIYILPEQLFSQFEDKTEIKAWNGFEDPSPITSGPFELVEWRTGDFWRLEANEAYVDGGPKIDELVYQVFKNEEALVEALKQGEIDFADSIPVNIAPQLENTPGITLHDGGQGYFIQMSYFQCTDKVPYCKDTGYTNHPALLDPVVRDALTLAIDRQEIVDKVRRGYGEAGTSVTIGTNKWHWEPETPPTQDLEAAAQMLEDAGYVDTDGDGIREMPDGGEPLNFRFVVRTENPDTINAGEFITAWFDEIGVGTEVTAVNDSKLTDLWYANDFDIYIWGWGPDPDPDFILSTFTTDQCGSWSDTCYSNPEYDQLYEDQRTAETVEEREAIVDEMQQMLYEDNPEVVLYYESTLQAYNSDKWTGFVQQPEPKGFLLFQYGTYSYRNIEPKTAANTAADDGGSNTGLIIGIIAAVVVVVIVVAVTMSRRRADEDEA